MNDEFVTVCFCPYCGSQLAAPQLETQWSGSYVFESFCPTCDDMIDADWMRIETIPAPESEDADDR